MQKIVTLCGVLLCASALCGSVVVAHAQWLNFKTPGVPRTRDGQPNLTAPAPRAVDGKPDLSGVWLHEIITAAEMKRLYGAFIDEAIKVDVPGMEIGTQHKYAFNILLDAGRGGVETRPKAEEIMKRAAATFTRPCADVAGFPLADLLSEPIKIVQSPRTTVVMYEAGNTHRQIYTDGRTLPKEYSFPAFLGYSAGHWEGDTLVVETEGFNDKTVLDILGHPHTEHMRVVERYRRRDFGHLDIDTTIVDPEMYTKPFTIHVPHDLLADADIFESFCENEKDQAHLKER